MTRRMLFATFVLLIAVVPGSQALARETYATIPATVQSGPSECNNLKVLQMGPANGKTVLVLIPGYLGGSGDFRVIGRRLTTQFKNLQVWGIDRRSQCLEDTTPFQGGTTTQQLGYYLFGSSYNGKTFRAPQIGDSAVEAARGWGLSTTLQDIRDVVLAAKQGGKQVILGGHSLGGSLTDLYAVWDFAGHPGYQDIKGMVLIDGGARGTFGAAPDAQTINNQLNSLAAGSPWSSLLNGIPVQYQGIFPELAANYAKKDPRGNSALQGLLNNIGMGAFTRPTSSGKLTNDAGLGYAFDRDSSPSYVELLHMNMGSIKESSKAGSAASWVDGGLTDLADVKTLFGSEPGNFVEWYFPKRLSIETGAATNLSKTDLTDSLGLRPWHLSKVNLPLYAFETGLTCSTRPQPNQAGFKAWISANKNTKCGVLNGAVSFKAGSKVTRLTLVSDHDQEHLDPLVARAKSNRLQSSLVAWLKSLRVS